MPIEIQPDSTVEDFLRQVLPGAYCAGLHRVPAKYATDMPLLLHSMTTLLVGDLLMNYLSQQTAGAAKQLADSKEEIWLCCFLHDILKEASIHGERVDHLDIVPDDLAAWLTRLGVTLRTTTPLRLAARVAMHERGGLPLLSALADVQEDDLPQLLIRLSDQLASLTAINEHWYYPGHGIPRIVETLEGHGRLSGLNRRLLELGASEPLTLLTHYHTRVAHPYLTNHLLAATVANLSASGLQPLLVLADGVVYIGPRRACALAEERAADPSPRGMAESILDKAWDQIFSAVSSSPLRPEDIRATPNGVKIFAQMRLVGTPLVGEPCLFGIVGTYLSQRVTTKAFSALPMAKRTDRARKFVDDALGLLASMPKHYADALQIAEKQLPVLRLHDQAITLRDLADLSAYPAEKLREEASRTGAPAALAREMVAFGGALATLTQEANAAEFQSELMARFRRSFEAATRRLVDGAIVVGNTPLSCRIDGLRLVDKCCPTCGQQAFKAKGASRAASAQRETFFPATIKSHTNSATGAQADGTRLACQVCALELGLRGMAFSAEAYRNKQTTLHMHLLPFFSFPMNWMDGARQQFGFSPRELRTQFSEATLRRLYKAFFSDDPEADWEWIRAIADPMRLITEGFFADKEASSRDEFFCAPPVGVTGSVTLSLYVRRNEPKPTGREPEDEIGRKEIWTRGITLAGLLAQALPVRVVLSESPLVNFDPAALRACLTLVNPPEVITTLLGRLRRARPVGVKFQPAENEVSHSELRDLLRLLVFALRANKTLGGSTIMADGREVSKRPSRRVVDIVQELADGFLVGAWLHQRDWQSRPAQYRPRWHSDDYRTFTRACMEVDEMLNRQEVDRLRELARITQTFYAPPVYDSAHALTLPFKIATKTLQRFDGTGVTEAEMKTIMRSDIESAIKRQANVEGSRAWIVLKRPRVQRAPDSPPVAVQLTEGVRAFVDAFMRDVVHGICGDITNYLLLRKRLQSGYLMQMKDLALETWEREGWRMFGARVAAGTEETADDLSISI